MTSEHLKGPSIKMPILQGMCSICQWCAIGFAQLDGDQYFATLLRLATLARSEGHPRFHRRMNRRMEEKKLGINLEILDQITFIDRKPTGLEFSKVIAHPIDNEEGDRAA